MHEIRRQQYLDALGIDSYMPRVLLPWAPAPRRISPPEIVVEEAPVRDRAAAPAPEARVESSPTPVAEVLRDMTRAQPAMEKKPAREALSLVRERPRPVATVHLHLWRPLPGYFILDDCPPGTALPTHRLLANILRALTGQAVNPGNPERVRCPINEQLASHYGEEDVRRELQAWFVEAYARQPAQQVWLLGPAARWFLPSGAEIRDSQFTRVALTLEEAGAEGEIQALIAPSLSDMLQDAALKAPLWQAIKPQ